MNNKTTRRSDRRYRTPLLLGLLMLLLAGGAVGFAEAASVDSEISSGNSTAQYADRTSNLKAVVTGTTTGTAGTQTQVTTSTPMASGTPVASMTTQATRTPRGTRTPTQGCQFAILSYHECLNSNGCTTFSIPVQTT